MKIKLYLLHVLKCMSISITTDISSSKAISMYILSWDSTICHRCTTNYGLHARNLYDNYTWQEHQIQACLHVLPIKVYISQKKCIQACVHKINQMWNESNCYVHSMKGINKTLYYAQKNKHNQLKWFGNESLDIGLQLYTIHNVLVLVCIFIM